MLNTFKSDIFPNLSASAVDLDDVFGHVDKLVDESLAVHFGQNTSLIVIPVKGRIEELINYFLHG